MIFLLNFNSFFKKLNSLWWLYCGKWTKQSTLDKYSASSCLGESHCLFHSQISLWTNGEGIKISLVLNSSYFSACCKWHRDLGCDGLQLDKEYKLSRDWFKQHTDLFYIHGHQTSRLKRIQTLEVLICIGDSSHSLPWN